MKRVFFTAVAGVLVGVLGLARPSAADTIDFDFTGDAGAGNVLSIDSFDWWPGNSILLEHDDGTFTILYQANLNISPDRDACSTDADFDCITAVAEFTVVPTATPGEFELVSGTFDMYAGTTYADDLIGGSAFADETLILSSTIIAPFGTASFTASGDPIEDLDQFGVNDWTGFFTVSGTGGFANVLTEVTFLETDYFSDPAFTTGSVLVTTLSAGSNNLPFTQVDPTDEFFDGTSGVPSTCGPGQTPGVNCINGTGSNIMTEADASTTIELTGAQVPEPATLTLLGIGLAGSAALRRRQTRKAKKQ